MKVKLTDPTEITQRRNELGLTRKDLADISRVDYTRVRDMEHGKYKYIDAPTLEALAFALREHPMRFSSEWEAPDMPSVTYVAIDHKPVVDYLEREGINPNEFARRAGIRNDYAYGLVSYGLRKIPADVARRIAKTIGYRPHELAPALLIYPGPNMQEIFAEEWGRYGGRVPEDVEALPES